jgi:hypothetical protein
MLIVRAGYKWNPAPPNGFGTPAGWSPVGTAFSTLGGVSSNGGGAVEVGAFWRIATSAAETSPIITFADGSSNATPGCGVALSYQKGADEVWDTPIGAGFEITAATSISEAVDSHVTAMTDDLVDEFHVTNDNTTLTVPTFTQAGLTLDTVTESPATALSSGTSNDISADGCFRKATAGTSSAAAVVTATNSIADIGAGFTTRLRAYVPIPHYRQPMMVGQAVHRASRW